MAERRLSPDEAALWRRVMASVRPLGPVRAIEAAAAEAVAAPTRRPTKHLTVRASEAVKPDRAAVLGVTLDAGWDRRLARGLVGPDAIVDLHGHGLQSAYQLLDRALAAAIADRARVVLLITGKPPTKDSERPHGRGAIRAAVGDWLSASRHADCIAAVRGAHPRHGGAGALYIVLRRERLVF